MRVALSAACSLVVILAGCAGAPEGLRATPEGDGPRVYIDWDARPLPELPFPNDLATRPDPQSPTGLRLNFSLDAPTLLERETREKVNELTGFGIFMPVAVRFDAPLDLDNIATRHAPDLDPSDDAFFLVDVTPDSPTFGQVADLDVGHGRFPVDVKQTDRYFPNDSRSDSPSILFETAEEDLNGNGVLDPGEDTDGDGVLDHPNVYPEGGDPRDDLIGWYERETDTLIFRPVVPLREETTYAVVLTERLLGVDGNPVRSPWEWVNHTRQTAALEPLVDVLPDLGLALDDVAFAWTYTTGRITGDMVDLRLGLDGEGPYAFLADEVSASITQPMIMHELPDVTNQFALPMDRLLNVLATLGVFPADFEDVMGPGFALTSHTVAAHFTTPDLLFDKDDGGHDSSDEWWQLDPVAGTVDYEPRKVAFTCIVPEADAGFPQPFPVVIYGHGYGSSRFEFFSLIGWAAARVGIASCGFDYPAHGPSISERDLAEYEPLLEATGLMPFLEHLYDSRYRDLDNDGEPDSGADQWTSDSFHTRDQVRQGALDMVQLLRALRSCGTETWGADVDKNGQKETSCDWDADGTPDIGGPDVDYFLAGGSLGGIVTTVAASVEPRIAASINIVSGGGLMDIGTRSNIGGAIEALAGRLWSPFILGMPDGAGGLDVVEFANSGFTNMRSVPIAHLDSVPAGGTVTVENLTNGEVRESPIPVDGRFRVSIPADGLDAYEKRVAAGIPHTGPVEGERYEIPDNAGLGDRLRITVSNAQGSVVAVLESFEDEQVFEAVTLPAGSPLVALSSGLGHVRGSPQHRRLVSSLSLITEPGDPIAYAPHYIERPFEEFFSAPLNVFQINTVGDPIVMINSSFAQARATGFIERHEVDSRYGMTVDNWLIDRRAVQGLAEHGPYTDINGNPCLFDVDDQDLGTDGTGAPSDEPLQATVQTSSGVSLFRVPYASTRGSHGFGDPDPADPFDWPTFVLNQATHYLHTRGRETTEDHCLMRNDCDFLRTPGRK